MDKEVKKNGPCVCFVLLDEPSFSFPEFIEELEEEWGITLPEEDYVKENDMLVTEAFQWGGTMLSIALMPAPVPGGEIVENAKTNFRWPKAVETAQSHKAHLVVAVLPGGNPVESSSLLVKLCATALRQQHAVGINTLGTVFSPEFYRAAAQASFQDERFPVMNLVFFGIYSRDNGETFCGYTYGLRDFGKKELEVLDSRQGHSEVLECMMGIAEYMIVEDAVLKDGETIGFTEEEKLPITESQGIAIDGITLKIEF